MDTSQDKDGKTDLFAVATSTVSFQEDVKEVPILLCTFHCLNSNVFWLCKSTERVFSEKKKSVTKHGTQNTRHSYFHFWARLFL